MGLPAVQHQRVAARSRLRLSLVPNEHNTGHAFTSPRVSARVREARCRSAFTGFLVVAVAFSVLGVARVALAARAAAISIESGRLREQIEDERFKGDMLEIQQSALATPSRIRAIAAATMRMKQAGAVCYITIDGTMRCAVEQPPGNKASVTTAANSSTSRPRAAGGLLSSIMNTAAGEAQALLLGDVGLASSR